MSAPLVIRVPGLSQPGLRVAAPVRLVDVMPTVLDLLAVDTELSFQGVSRAGSDNARRTVTTFSYTGFVDYPYHVTTVRTDRYKLHVWSLAGMASSVSS